MRIFPSYEALIQPGLVQDIQAGQLVTLNNSRYLLLKLSNTEWQQETECKIFELRAFGVVPILAHQERYRAIQKDPQRLAALRHQGVLAQITASSLIGKQGNTAHCYAETLLNKGLIICMSSDAHGLGKRTPGVTRGLQSAIELVGQERVYQVTEIAPAAIFNNQVLYL